VIARAEEVLRQLEAGQQADAAARLGDDLPLFSAARPKSSGHAGAEPSAVEAALKGINPDELSPRDALEALYKLRGLLSKD
jgi:DNA mismatch repair protein MutS